MTFLPVLERELRVAARKRSTFWFRVVAAIVAVIIGGMVIVFYNVARMTFNLGGVLFNVLTWFAMAAAVFSGLFFTADCLSEEKREGTIGFLFLTDLRGYDVVGGKLLTQSLRSVYGLLAVFPVLAMIMLMGGVSGAQFWKTNLALLNALVCSLMTGVFISARSTNSQKALAGTFCGLVLFLGLGPLVDSLLGLYSPHAAVTSPIYVLLATYKPQTEFWVGLLVCQSIAWGLFAWTCVALPRKWQESERTAETNRGWAYFWKYGSAKGRARRRQFMGTNPVLWLTSREQWQARWLWIGVLTGTVTQLALTFLLKDDSTAKFVVSMLWGYLQGLITFFVYIWTASQATRFFAEARRSGFLELLLATPLSVGEILGGTWQAFLRTFGGPILLMVATQLCVGPAMHLVASRAVRARTQAVASARKSSKSVSTNGTTVTNSNGATTTTTTTTFTMPEIPFWLTLGMVVAGVVSYLFNLIAIYWFGAWMALTSKNGNAAVLKTLVFVLVIPWIVINFVAGLISIWTIVPMMRGGATSSMMWFPYVTVAFTTMLKVITDLVFITSARRKLHERFREQAVNAAAPIVVVAPPVLQPATI